MKTAKEGRKIKTAKEMADITAKFQETIRQNKIDALMSIIIMRAASGEKFYESGTQFTNGELNLLKENGYKVANISFIDRGCPVTRYQISW